MQRLVKNITRSARVEADHTPRPPTIRAAIFGRSRALLPVFAVATICTSAALSQPANDHCTNPTPITGAGTFQYDMNGAVFTDEVLCNSDIAHDVWFCWTATCDGPIMINTCGQTTQDTNIAIYAGCGCPNDVVPPRDPLCCNDDSPTPGCAPQSEVTCNVVCGERYMIRIADKDFNGGPGSGGGEFTISCTTPCMTPGGGECVDCCAATPRFSGFPGTVVVMTQERSSGDPLLLDHAVDLIDISGQATATLGTNWCAPPFYLPTAVQGWRYQDLGTVFGTTLDNEGNIYLTHTSIYGDAFFGIPIHDAFGSRAPANQGAGAIYKINTNTGISSWLTSLPNFIESSPATKFINVPPASELYPGLGNICFDCTSASLYVSNFEDGRIYRLTKSGTILESYDHATGAITPWSGSAPEPNDPRGWCPLGERVWAVGVNQGRLYYSIWAEDFDPSFGGTNRPAPNFANANEIWSIPVTPAGAITGVAQLEITLPIYPGAGQASNPVSDLTFTDSCCMLLAERSMHDDTTSGSHSARILQYCQDDQGVWTLQPEQYLAAPGVPNSSAGGIAFDPNQSAQTVVQVWTSMDALGGGAVDCAGGALAYGAAGFPLTGGTTPTNGIQIDIDRNTSAFDKFRLGSIDVSCVKCASLESEKILCDVDPASGPTGTYTYEYCLTNNSGVPVHFLLYPTLTPHVVWIAQNAAWQPGETRCFTVTLTGDPGDEICFPVILADRQVNECCRTDLCVTLPDCDCLQFPECDITCADLTPGTYFVSFTLQNLAYNPAAHMFIIPEPPNSGVVIGPNYMPINIPMWGIGGVFNLQVTVPPNLSEFCLRFTIHATNLEDCCSEVKCFEVPDCSVVGLLLCDTNCDGFVSVSDIGPFVLALTNPAQYAIQFPGCPLANSDMNSDGAVTVSDIGLFVQSLVQ